MFLKNLKKTLLLIAFCSLVSAHNVTVASSNEPLHLKAEANNANMEMVVKDNFIKAKYASAENRFLQGNVKASYDDFMNRKRIDEYVS